MSEKLVWCDENQKSKQLHEDIKGCLESLKMVRGVISFQDIVNWLSANKKHRFANEKEIDYVGMSDLDMYIYYIEQN